MEMQNLIINNYMPYSKSSIISRAIAAIDGFKPVQRRVLYTMHDMGLHDKTRVKSQKINGTTMGLHPHGDSSIYEALVLMTKDYDGLNIPYIDSKGSFGKIYSRDLKYAAPRYTEAKLAPISSELFDGIKENAVEFIDNFDGTLKEPTLLPVKFPTILVNNNSGIAVGTSSNIPSFSLTNVCKATIGVLKDEIKTPQELAGVLGAPEFTTGGFLHCSEKSLTKLCETGKGSFIISGKVEVYADRIVITEIPYCTTAEDIMDTIEEAVKEKKLRGIRDVNNEIGLEGFKLVVQLKSGYNPRQILAQLCRITTLRTSISFRTRVIVENRCRELGLLELLQLWINFRQTCIQRVYQFRVDKNKADEHLLKAWEKIANDIEKVATTIAKSTDEQAKNFLMTVYKLDDEQANYILDMKIRYLTKDKAIKSLQKLAGIREELKTNNKIVTDMNERKKIIINQLTEIIDKYGTQNKTIGVDELTPEQLKEPVQKISDETVTVIYTQNGYVRRLTSLKDLNKTFVSKDGEEEVLRWIVKNNDYLLVFDRFGVVHKVLVDNIDASNKATMTDKLYELAGLEKAEDLIWADACGDYSKYFNIVYPNGRGTRVLYSRAKGSRMKYKGLYDEVQPRRYWVTSEDKFFMITFRDKAAYCDLTRLGLFNSRLAFKIARNSPNDGFQRLLPAKDVPNIALINLSKYTRGYTVAIKNDILWIDEEHMEETKKQFNKLAEKYRKLENGEDIDEEETDQEEQEIDQETEEQKESIN